MKERIWASKKDMLEQYPQKKVFRRFEVINAPIDETYNPFDAWGPVKTHDFETEEEAKKWDIKNDQLF